MLSASAASGLDGGLSPERAAMADADAELCARRIENHTEKAPRCPRGYWTSVVYKYRPFRNTQTNATGPAFSAAATHLGFGERPPLTIQPFAGEKSPGHDGSRTFMKRVQSSH